MIISEIVSVAEARKNKRNHRHDQVRASEKKPKKIKPSSGGESPHPYQGRLVGNG